MKSAEYIYINNQKLCQLAYVMLAQNKNIKKKGQTIDTVLLIGDLI